MYTTLKKDIKKFEKLWKNEHSKLLLEEKQSLIFQFLEFQFSENQDFDIDGIFTLNSLIKTANISLDFHIQHKAPSLLCYSVYTCSKHLFNFLLKNNASINYIVDMYYYESKETIKDEVGSTKNERYLTCLDFAELQLADMLTVDYNYTIPKHDTSIKLSDIDSGEGISVQKKQYYYLLEQAKYLKDVIETSNLISHIKSCGGKTYEELQKLKTHETLE